MLKSTPANAFLDINDLKLKLEALKENVFLSDNKACFIERERILHNISNEMKDVDAPDYYACLLSRLLAEVSTPVDQNDLFAGRVVEAVPDENLSAPNTLLESTGHMCFDYEKILQIGLKGILEEINRNAMNLGDEKSLEYASNAGIVVTAIKNYAHRYAIAASENGMANASKALEIVPFERATDYYSALQSIWLIHMIASCYVGARDYAFGRFDQYMYPYYIKAVADGMPHEEIVGLLAGFFMKTNEICGRTTWNHQTKPILSHSSKQYVVLGGESPNDFSSIILEAAELCNMAQPQITVLLKNDSDPVFKKRVFQCMSIITDKLHVYNYDSIKSYLNNKGLPDDIASDFTFSACCSFDLNHHTIRQEKFVPSVQIFNETLEARNYLNTEEIAREYSSRLRDYLQIYANDAIQNRSMKDNRKLFVLDGLLIGDCVKRCRYPMDGGMRYHALNIFFPGIATLGDSLAALDKMVYQEKRYTYDAFMDIVGKDFQLQEDLRSELVNSIKFGNDNAVDDFTVRMANACLDAVDQMKLPENYLAVGGFYSLDTDNSWAAAISATPDGRHAGTPVSENQSPVYGGDRTGITALLKSLSKLPFQRTATGGLNLSFSRMISPSILQALLTTYFNMGGLHAGMTVMNRETLQDAMVHPDKYKSLTVRLYGFSEYFVSLPEWQQLALLKRTEYAVL